MLTAHGVSHPGRLRKINEDTWLSLPEIGVFVVADGMGGHNAGEVASQLAVETIQAFMRRTAEGDDVTWPYGIDPKFSFEVNRLRTAVKLANRRVFKAAESRDDYTGMGTTVVAAMIREGHLVFSGVGDSRLYLWSGGTLQQLTTDDSWAAAVQGTARPTEGGPAHSMRHVLTNVVGAREQVEFEVRERPLADGDLLLFCSDGLHGELPDERLTAIFASSKDPATIADALVRAVLADTRARDNVTALVVRWNA